MSKSALIWGGLLILIGILLILNNLGIIEANVWGIIWALLLIALGVWFLVGSSMRRSRKVTQADIPYLGAREARLVFRHGAGKLVLKAGSNDQILISGQFAGGVEINEQKGNEIHQVTLQVPGSYFPVGWLPDGALDWTVDLKRGLLFELAFETGAQETYLDLTDLMVRSLRLSTGASTSRIQLPANAGNTRVELKAGAATFEMIVPVGVAARIRSSSGLSTLNVDSIRFPRKNGGFQSSDFETAQNRIDISIESGLATVNIR